MKNKYDVVIIGAGIGGLVCGGYLAKQHRKVLILERSSSLGGYCRSFIANKRFLFDSCVHSIGSCRKHGYVSRVIDEFQLNIKVSFKRYDPSDIVFTKNSKLIFGSDIQSCIRVLKKAYPSEKFNIDKFFSLLTTTNQQVAFLRFRNVSFLKLLNIFFSNSELKAVFGVLILGNAALPPLYVSAFTALTLLKEFIFDGGYYLEDGFQSLSNALGERVAEWGGQIIKGVEVKDILFDENKAIGVRIDDGHEIYAKKIIANSCSKYIVDQLIEENILNKHSIVNKLKPSLSSVTVFLGIDDNLKIENELYANIWLLPTANLTKMYKKIVNGNVWAKDIFLLAYMHRLICKKDRTICLFVNAPFRKDNFWKNKRELTKNSIINKFLNYFPNFRKNISYSNIATPKAVMGYANSYMGASYGWESTPGQVWNTKIIKEMTSIKNLHFISHWITKGFGVASVMDIARSESNRILKSIK